VRIVLDAEAGDLGIHGRGDFALRRINLRAALLRCADDVEGAPGEHAGDGVEVGGVNIAAEPRRLEGDRSAAAKGVRHLRPVAEARDPQLLDQFGKA
jgi:hypothetical protein